MSLLDPTNLLRRAWTEKSTGGSVMVTRTSTIRSSATAPHGDEAPVTTADITRAVREIVMSGFVTREGGYPCAS
jgi:hypothetical protein